MSKLQSRSITMGFCIFVLTAFNGPAIADAELFTPVLSDPLNIGYSGSCNIVNVSDKPRTVTILLIDGSAAGAGPTDTKTLSPGAAMTLPLQACTDGCLLYCKFSVQGNKHEYRASICNNNVGCLSAE